MNKIAALLFFLLLLLGCKKDDNTPTAQQYKCYYTAFYSYNENRTYCTAEFRTASGTAALESGAEIKCNGIPMTIESHSSPGPYLPYTEYTTSFNGIVSCNFTYKNSAGRMFTNSISLDQMGFSTFATNVNNVNATDTLFVPFTGGVINQNEEIELMVIQDQQHFAGDVFNSQNLNDTICKLTPDKMTYLTNGWGQIKFTKTKTLSLQEPDASGGEMKAGWSSIQNIVVTQ